MKKKSKQKESRLKRYYRESWEYIKESKNYIWFTAGIFVFFALIAIIFPIHPNLEQFILEEIRQIVEATQGLSTLGLVKFILINNAVISFFVILLGILVGVLPLLSAILNGYVLGYVSKIVIVEASIFELWRLFPHGIFELPAVIISMALGIKLGMFVFSKKPIKELKKRFVNGMKTFVFIILPLLIIAAIIEGILIGFSI